MNPQNIKIDADAQVHELYNAFMADFEPDLMTENIPHLDEWYKDETQEQRAARFQRYAFALQEFGDRYRDFVDLVKQSLLDAKTTIIAKATKKSKKEDKKKLSDIERSIDQQ